MTATSPPGDPRLFSAQQRDAERERCRERAVSSHLLNSPGIGPGSTGASGRAESRRCPHVHHPLQRRPPPRRRSSTSPGSPTSGRAARSSSATAPTTTSRCTPRARTDADVTEGSGGIWERLHYDWSDPDRVVADDHRLQRVGRRSGHTYTLHAAARRDDRDRRRRGPRGQEPQGPVPRRSCSGPSARASWRRRSRTPSRRSRRATPRISADRV